MGPDRVARERLPAFADGTLMVTSNFFLTEVVDAMFRNAVILDKLTGKFWMKLLPSVSVWSAMKVPSVRSGMLLVEGTCT